MPLREGYEGFSDDGGLLDHGFCTKRMSFTRFSKETVDTVVCHGTIITAKELESRSEEKPEEMDSEYPAPDGELKHCTVME